MTPSSKDHVLKTHREEAVKAAVARVNAVAQRIGPESVTDALRQYPQAHPHHRANEFAHDLREIIAAWNRRADPLVEELGGALEPLLVALDQLYEDNPILCDCVDNSGRPYTSAWLASQLETISTQHAVAREALALPVGNISACTDSAGEEPDGSFAGEAQRKSEGGV